MLPHQRRFPNERMTRAWTLFGSGLCCLSLTTYLGLQDNWLWVFPAGLVIWIAYSMKVTLGAPPQECKNCKGMKGFYYNGEPPYYQCESCKGKGHV